MIDYDKLFTAVEKTVLSSSLYWQSLGLILSFAISYIFYRLIKILFLPKIISLSLRKNVELNRFVTRYLVPLAYPLITAIILALGLSIYEQFFKEAVLFITTLKLILLFSFLRFLRISSNSTLIANVVGIVLMPALVLDIFGMLDATAYFLDQYALKLGSVRISVYLVLKSFIVLLLVFWSSSLITKKSKSYIESSKTIKTSTKGIISKFIDISVYALVAVIILKTLGFDTTTFTVLGGAIGVGIGFGLQKIASNFISGIILLFEKSIEVGDWVEIDNGGIFGVVKHFGGRYTIIECFDGKEVMVPNEDLIINKVTNWTYSNNRARIEIEFAVAHGSDLDKVMEIAHEVAKDNSRCLSYPEIECYVTKFGEYDIKCVLYFWISDITKGRQPVKSEAYISLWRKLKEGGINIPMPRREVVISDKNLSEF